MLHQYCIVERSFRKPPVELFVNRTYTGDLALRTRLAMQHKDWDCVFLEKSLVKWI